MAARDNFTVAEWELLQRTIETATGAIMAAQPGGMVQEVFAVFAGWEEARSMFAGNEFVQELLHISPDELREKNDEEDPESTRTAADILKNAVEKCRACNALLMQRDPADAETYRRVVLFLADKTANAASEGGFFGIGSKPISKAEHFALRELAEALGEEFQG